MWAVLETEPAREVAVFKQACKKGLECQMPLDLREYRAGKARRRALKEVPLIPRHIFVRGTLCALEQVPEIKYAKGLKRDKRDEQFRAWAISDRQMERFINAIEQWHLQNRPKNITIKSFQELQEFLDSLAGGEI